MYLFFIFTVIFVFMPVVVMTVVAIGCSRATTSFPPYIIMIEFIYFDHIGRSLHFNVHFETKILRDMLHEISILCPKLDPPTHFFP